MILDLLQALRCYFNGFIIAGFSVVTAIKLKRLFQIVWFRLVDAKFAFLANPTYLFAFGRNCNLDQIVSRRLPFQGTAQRTFETSTRNV